MQIFFLLSLTSFFLFQTRLMGSCCDKPDTNEVVYIASENADQSGSKYSLDSEKEMQRELLRQAFKLIEERRRNPMGKHGGNAEKHSQKIALAGFLGMM